MTTLDTFWEHMDNPCDYSKKMQTKKATKGIDKICNQLKHLEVSKLNPNVPLNVTHTYRIDFTPLPDLTLEATYGLFSNGSFFAPYIEQWLVTKYPSLVHVKGCKNWDFYDARHHSILYDEKTFTKSGLKFCPSSMIGTGRKFDKEKFIRKANRLIYCFVSNINLPEVKVRFVRGSDLVGAYPTGNIPSKDHGKIFN